MMQLLASAAILTPWNNNIFFSRISDHLCPGCIDNRQMKYPSNNNAYLFITAECCAILHVLVTPGWLKMKMGWEPSSDWTDGSACSCPCTACWAATVISPAGRGAI